MNGPHPTSQHPNSKNLHHISITIFVTNFPTTVSSKDLWKLCDRQGVVADVYIARKLSKSGRRFGFVRFIKNPDHDGVNVVYSVKKKIDLDDCGTRGHGGDGGGYDRPPTHHIPTGCGGCFANRCKSHHGKPNWVKGKAVRMHYPRQERAGDAFVLPFLAKGPDGAKGGDLDKDRDCRTPILTVKPSHSIQSLDKYQFGHPTAFAKVYTIPTRFSPGSALDWDAQLAFWNDPRNLARAAQNRQNRAKKHSLCSLSLTLEDVEAAASRLQHRDGCALHRRRDHGHRSKGQAAGAPSRLFESSLEFRGASESGGCGDDEPGGDEDVTRMRRMRNLLEIMRAPPSRSRKSPGNESLASFPLQLIPGDMSPEIGFPSDKSPGKAWKYRWGLW
ncbi:RNA-directed DNA polymerase, eukaryota [Tanacetum coccineum]